VLASHSHPSVATMARTLLSGANIVYNGNPLNDLSLTAFLDKFMEKKPKQTTWHGGSQIEPVKQVNKVLLCCHTKLTLNKWLMQFKYVVNYIQWIVNEKNRVLLLINPH
jgi:hypothetical protein